MPKKVDTGGQPPSRRGKRGVQVYFNEFDHRRLKKLAIENSISFQALMLEGVDLWLAAKGERKLVRD